LFLNPYLLEYQKVPAGFCIKKDHPCLSPVLEACSKLAFRDYTVPVQKGSVADPDDFCPDPTFQIVWARKRALAHINFVQSSKPFSKKKFFCPCVKAFKLFKEMTVTIHTYHNTFLH
jgi:hypothetical protein